MNRIARYYDRQVDVAERPASPALRGARRELLKLCDDIANVAVKGDRTPNEFAGLVLAMDEMLALEVGLDTMRTVRVNADGSVDAWQLGRWTRFTTFGDGVSLGICLAIQQLESLAKCVAVKSEERFGIRLAMRSAEERSAAIIRRMYKDGAARDARRGRRGGAVVKDAGIVGRSRWQGCWRAVEFAVGLIGLALAAMAAEWWAAR